MSNHKRRLTNNASLDKKEFTSITTCVNCTVVLRMNKSEIKVDYAVRSITANESNHDPYGRRERRRPQSASAAASTGRRNSLLAATIQEEFVSRKSNRQNGGAMNSTTQNNFGLDKHTGGLNVPQKGITSANSFGYNKGMLAAEVPTINAPPFSDGSLAMRSRPATAPKRRPPVMIHEEQELPLWRSRGTIDLSDTLLQQDNKVSVYRRKDWPKAPKPPAPLETVLGLENSESRKTIKSSHSRSRVPKTSGPIANLKPFKMPAHYFPSKIVRSDVPAESPSLRARDRWSFETTTMDIYERAKPSKKPDMSPDHFHETFRISPHVDRDYIDVSIGIETITASYPRGRF